MKIRKRAITIIVCLTLTALFLFAWYKERFIRGSKLIKNVQENTSIMVEVTRETSDDNETLLYRELSDSEQQAFYDAFSKVKLKNLENPGTTVFPVDSEYRFCFHFYNAQSTEVEILKFYWTDYLIYDYFPGNTDSEYGIFKMLSGDIDVFFNELCKTNKGEE